jgi:hypothetical protein
LKSKIFDDLKIVWIGFSCKKPMGFTNKNHKFIRFKHTNLQFSNSIFPLSYFDDLYLSLYNIFKKISPKSVILLEGDAPYHILSSYACEKLNVKTICFQWGLLPTYKSKTAFSNMSFSYFMTWGKYFTNQLIEYNPKQKFLDFGYLNFPNQQSSGQKILFLDQGGCFENVSNYHIHLFRNIAVKLAKSFPRNVLLRPHPNDPPSPEDINILVKGGVQITDSTGPISDDLIQSKVSISIQSSSLLDSFVFGVIPVSFHHEQMDSYPFPFNQYKIGLESASVRVIYDFIYKICTDDSFHENYQLNIKRFSNKFFKKSTKDQMKKVLNSCVH